MKCARAECDRRKSARIYFPIPNRTRLTSRSLFADENLIVSIDLCVEGREIQMHQNRGRLRR